MVDIGRRQFLRGSGLAAAGLATAAALPQNAKAAQQLARVAYPSNRLDNVAIRTGAALDTLAELYQHARRAVVGIGDVERLVDGQIADIVGFSTICPHKGFPMTYDSGDRTLNCPGHYSRFDVEKGGQQIWGQATQNLPQYTLRIDDKGDIYAEGLDELLYGRLNNVLS
jgi:arsenite oxidase small subunit